MIDGFVRVDRARRRTPAGSLVRPVHFVKERDAVGVPGPHEICPTAQRAHAENQWEQDRTEIAYSAAFHEPK